MLHNYYMRCMLSSRVAIVNRVVGLAVSISRILQWRGFTWRGPDQVAWGRKSPSGVQGQSPGRGPGGRSPQKLKQNVCNF